MAMLVKNFEFKYFKIAEPDLTLSDKVAQLFGNPISDQVRNDFETSLTQMKIQRNYVGTFCLTQPNTFTPKKIQIFAPSLGSFVYPILNADSVRQVMKQNLRIKVQSRNMEFAKIQKTKAEEQAQNTLRDLVSEREWRRYVTNGFIMVKGKSGAWYQVFATQHHIRVYKDNHFTHEICLHSDPSVPPTDHVLNMKTLIEMDETILWQEGNVTNRDHLNPWSQYLVEAAMDSGQKHYDKFNNVMRIFKYYKGVG